MFKPCKIKILPTDKETILPGELHLRSQLSTGYESMGWYHTLFRSVNGDKMGEKKFSSDFDKSMSIYILSEDDKIKKDDYIGYNNLDVWTPVQIKEFDRLTHEIKIVSTDDLSIPLPRLSDRFVRKCLDIYNRNLPHTIMVEYDDEGNVKVDKFGFINAKLIKQIFNIHEVMELNISFHNELYNNMDKTTGVIEDKEKIIENWRNNNLYETV